MEPCDDGTMNHSWSRAELHCEDCGDHPGFMCGLCDETVDAIFQWLDAAKIEETLDGS